MACRKHALFQASSTASYRQAHIIKSDDTGKTETVNYFLLDISDLVRDGRLLFSSVLVFSPSATS